MTETKAIHPASNQLRAESPYTRKLQRLLEDIRMVESLAPFEDQLAFVSIADALQKLLEV